MLYYIYLQILLVSLFSAIRSNHGERREELFYIYDTAEWDPILKAPITARSPQENTDLTMNGGAGLCMNESLSLYHTNQYSLFQLMFNRALKDPRRTVDPALATTFIIPFDFASDAAYFAQTGPHHLEMITRKCPLGSLVSSLLIKSPWFQRKTGLDHLLVVGMNYGMSDYLLRPQVSKKNPSFIVYKIM